MRNGFTLLELLVSLTIIAVLLGVVGLAFHSPAHAEDASLATLTAARDSAVISGHDVTARVDRAIILFLPDGSARVTPADSAQPPIDELTGLAYAKHQ